MIAGDRPDALRENRYVLHRSDDRSADEALAGFQRFPTWMWRNTVVRDFVEWLHERNARLPAHERCGFYGMDLYSMYASMQSVLEYLDREGPGAATRARARCGCFEHFGEDQQTYGYVASFGMGASCAPTRPSSATRPPPRWASKANGMSATPGRRRALRAGAAGDLPVRPVSRPD
ncbi:erythromycin esterase family protein [Ramlibacter sp. GTP1]|uniref:Erythromycin esterase family protein n=1 Tax=Ramlibacter albus TaxID=2079448 RepID=A0A923S4C3_9BURK|nr:erythromycin esterase family protein [Ramlibacter albus]